MLDINFALAAKSDQLNAIDIMNEDRIIKIRNVSLEKREQPVWIYFDGDNDRPWKPSKGMLRILAGAWGKDTKQWIGKYAQLFFEPSVMYAGQKVGGIRIKALSHIDKDGLNFSLVINRKKREPYLVHNLEIDDTPYPNDKFDSLFPKMIEQMNSGKMSLQEVISQCHKTGTLSKDQLIRLENSAPEILDGD